MTARNQWLATRKRVLPITQARWCPDLRLPASRAVRNKRIVYEPSSLYSVRAAGAMTPELPQTHPTSCFRLLTLFKVVPPTWNASPTPAPNPPSPPQITTYLLPLLIYPGMTNHSLLGLQGLPDTLLSHHFLCLLLHTCAQAAHFSRHNHLTLIFSPTGAQWAFSKHWLAGRIPGKPDPARQSTKYLAANTR